MLSREASRWALPARLGRIRARLGRAVTHENAKRASKALVSGGTIPLLGPIAVSADLMQVAEAVFALHDARQIADYDLEARFRRMEALEFVRQAEAAVETWRRVRDSDGARVYLLLLLVYGNLRDR